MFFLFKNLKMAKSKLEYIWLDGTQQLLVLEVKLKLKTILVEN